MHYKNFLEECEYFNIDLNQTDIYVTDVRISKKGLYYISNLRSIKCRLVDIENTGLRKRYDEQHALQLYGKKGNLINKFISVYPNYSSDEQDSVELFLSKVQADELLYRQVNEAQKTINYYLSKYKARHCENVKTLEKL